MIILKENPKKLTSEEKKSYKIFLIEYDAYKKKYNKNNHQNINQIRKIIRDHPAPGKVEKTSGDLYPIIHLGGIPMIADDMMTFIKNDIGVWDGSIFIYYLYTLVCV